MQEFLELPNGIPSHDTFARVFARIDPQQFQECFLSWIKSVSKITSGEVIAIDGKTLKHSYDKGAEKGAIHMVSPVSHRRVSRRRQLANPKGQRLGYW